MERNYEPNDDKTGSLNAARFYDLGRFLAAFEPIAANELAALKVEHPVIQGIRAGKVAYEQDQQKFRTSVLPEWTQRAPIRETFNDRAMKDMDLDER